MALVTSSDALVTASDSGRSELIRVWTRSPLPWGQSMSTRRTNSYTGCAFQLSAGLFISSDFIAGAKIMAREGLDLRGATRDGLEDFPLNPV